jgi:uncharacterized protein
VILVLDSSALIYYFEGAAAFKHAVVNALRNIKSITPDAQVAVCRLALMECRAKPLREGNATLLAQYDAFFATTQIVELNAEVVEAATQLRASTSLKTPDCLHAACAMRLGADALMLTGDQAFNRVHGLRCQVLSPTTTGSTKM